MDEKWGWSGAVGAAIVVSIFACIAISASGGWPIVQGAFVWIANWVDGVNGSTWASWAQAVGSVAAVWVALKLATKGDKRKHQEDLDRAALVAARLSQLVDGVLEKLRFTQTVLDFRDEFGVDEVASLTTCMRMAKETLRAISISDLTSLVPLPNHAAHKLARAVAMLDDLADEVANVQHWDQILKRSLHHQVEGWTRRLSDGIELLMVSKRALIASADRVAPPPTPEELYGPHGNEND